MEVRDRDLDCGRVGDPARLSGTAGCVAVPVPTGWGEPYRRRYCRPVPAVGGERIELVPARVRPELQSHGGSFRLMPSRPAGPMPRPSPAGSARAGLRLPQRSLGKGHDRIGDGMEPNRVEDVEAVLGAGEFGVDHRLVRGRTEVVGKRACLWGGYEGVQPAVNDEGRRHVGGRLRSPGCLIETHETVVAIE